jgi:hypothetical protein
LLEPHHDVCLELLQPQLDVIEEQSDVVEEQNNDLNAPI